MDCRILNVAVQAFLENNIVNEMIDKVHKIVTDDRWLTVNETAEAAGRWCKCANAILHEYLGTAKLTDGCCVFWRWRLGTPKSLLEHFLTIYETLVHHNVPETKNNQNSGLQRINWFSKRWLWWYFGIHMGLFTVTQKKVKQYIVCIMLTYYSV